MFRRNIKNRLVEALRDTPVVLINGARQTGKSTLAVEVAENRGAAYLTFDDSTLLAAATMDAEGFLASYAGNLAIDEVQKVPALFPALKRAVDRSRSPGRFLLTGSANVPALPKISESLAGRMEILPLFPLSMGELSGHCERFVDRIFSSTWSPDGAEDSLAGNIWERVTVGGYPEAVERKDYHRRQAWFAAYISTILHRDIRDLANINGLTEMPRLLSLLAMRTGALLNMSELSRSLGIPNTSLKRYLSLMEATFLFQPLRAWAENFGKRLIKSSKIYLLDSGLAGHLAGYTGSHTAAEAIFRGPLLECFVLSELRKQLGWSDIRAQIYHYRSTDGKEVDFILEEPGGSLVALEVKAAARVAPGDFSGIRNFARSAGERFLRGAVLYTGSQSVPFGDRLWALPVSTLWRP